MLPESSPALLLHAMHASASLSTDGVCVGLVEL
jgi:hypothetical protein